MMLTWNTLPLMRIGDSIKGIQARYFEPFLPLLVCIVFHAPGENLTATKDSKAESNKTQPPKIKETGEETTKKSQNTEAI